MQLVLGIRAELTGAVLCLVLAAVACIAPSHAGPQSVGRDHDANVGTTLLARLQQSASTNLEKATFLARPEASSLEAVREQLNVLERELNARAAPIPAEFQASLDSLSLSLTNLNLAGSDDSNKRVLDDVLSDLMLKNQYLSKAALGGFSFKQSLLVRVRVKTLKGGKEFPGYTVGFYPLRDNLTGPPRFPVSSTTNSAERLLPPGLYSMQLARGAEVHTARVEVGATGRDEESIETEL